jgi:uncharacterized damage-inducible protein DinB
MHTPESRAKHIAAIEALHRQLREAVSGLTDAQLDTRYRPEGWTLRQVVHHLADSHQNCYTRFKLALTEDHPTIKPYDEAAWAELPDGKSGPIEPSLALLDALHVRWAATLRNMKETDFARTFYHPDNGDTSLDTALAMYDWHSAHHLAHITKTKEREWNA